MSNTESPQTLRGRLRARVIHAAVWTAGALGAAGIVVGGAIQVAKSPKRYSPQSAAAVVEGSDEYRRVLSKIQSVLQQQRRAVVFHDTTIVRHEATFVWDAVSWLSFLEPLRPLLSEDALRVAQEFHSASCEIAFEEGPTLVRGRARYRVSPIGAPTPLGSFEKLARSRLPSVVREARLALDTRAAVLRAGGTPVTLAPYTSFNVRIAIRDLGRGRQPQRMAGVELVDVVEAPDFPGWSLCNDNGRWADPACDQGLPGFLPITEVGEALWVQDGAGLATLSWRAVNGGLHTLSVTRVADGVLRISHRVSEESDPTIAAGRQELVMTSTTTQVGSAARVVDPRFVRAAPTIAVAPSASTPIASRFSPASRTVFSGPVAPPPPQPAAYDGRGTTRVDRALDWAIDKVTPESTGHVRAMQRDGVKAVVDPRPNQDHLGSMIAHIKASMEEPQ